VVFGPAYLDRVLRVDQPLIDPAVGPPLDQGLEAVATSETGATLELVDPSGYRIVLLPPADWPGPTGEVRLAGPIRAGLRGRRVVPGRAWQDDLGGMGAGYAVALGGALWSALGPESDAASRAIVEHLARFGITHHPIRVPDRSADWTLLISSGACGDKLAIGFRGCHAALTPDALESMAAEPCDLRVVAALPNRLAARALAAPGAALRFCAPTLRTMLDCDCPLSSFAAWVDVLSCNRREWEALKDREEVAWRVSILAVTDGPNGSSVRFTTPAGEPGRFQVPAFPRDRPPRDTNRAGEAYAATLIHTLLDCDWSAGSGVVDEDLIRLAAQRASAAAALVLDRLDFGFPSPAEIDVALRAGRVG
jgi:ribokinase